MLLISHGWDVPEIPSVTCLYEIAVLCDKYDCVELTKPWLKTWLIGWFEQLDLEAGPHATDLFIAWEFGLWQAAAEIEYYFVLCLEMNEKVSYVIRWMDCLT